MKLSPSILASDLTDLKHILKTIENQVDYLHLDIMDGHFVPTLSFGEVYVKLLKEHSRIPLDVHLMVQNPEKEVPKYFEFEPFVITFHYEATHFPVRLANEIKKNNIQCGISINPKTPVEFLEPFLEYIDLVLIMSVEPGFYGQKFLDFSIQKIQKLKELILKKNLKTLIEVDGGINEKNLAEVLKAGADIVVSGASVFKGNISENIEKLKSIKI